MQNPYQSPEAPTPANALTASRAIACPHCGGPAMSLFTKSRMGPWKPRRCRACEAAVSVGWSWVGISVSAGFVPPILLILAVRLLADDAGRIHDEAVWEVYGFWILIGVGIGTALLGGGIQAAVLTLLAPLVKR